MQKIIDDFLWGLSNCDKVVVVLTGVGEKEFSTKEIYESIDELKINADKWGEKETPKEVIDEDGITFSCPTCYADNSKWIDWSMLQRQPKRAKVCQECGQRLKWSE